MKKSATFLTLLLILFLSITVLAAENETTSNDEPTDSTKIDDAFTCLEAEVGDCTGLTTQELAFTILATPDNVFDDCVAELKKREDSSHWKTILETSLAIIALKHAGEDTAPFEEWLLAQNKTPTDLIWYLQQDSDEAAKCKAGYATKLYEFNVNVNKKIDTNAGPCLTKSQASFWLQISNTCYDESFQIECDQDFIANLVYRTRNSPTIYVLKGTDSKPAFESIKLKVESKCFGETSCDYEATVWAALALQKTGHNIEEFIPYIIAMSETNERYLPSSFIYMVKNYDNYASILISEQNQLGSYWQATSTAYNKYYDTSLALLALSSSSAEQIAKAKDWLLFSQDSNGCWQKNSVRETAMALWALEGKPGRSASTASSVTTCSEGNFFCIPSAECILGEDVTDSYFCGIGDTVCCTNQNIKTCSEYSGQICASDKMCIGTLKKATDTDNCCTGTCEERPQYEDEALGNECTDNFYTCKDTCSDSQRQISAYSCDQGQTCCGSKEPGSIWWIWVLILLILITLGAIGYVYREQLKLYWFQLQTKFKKDDRKDSKTIAGTRPPSMPPRPGFPPVRRPRPPMPPRQARPQARPQPVQATKGKQSRSYDRRDKAMSDTFKKLRDMSK